MFTILAIATTNAGVLPAAFVAPYASSYNAHTVNHAVASPLVHSAPLIASSPYVAAAPAVYSSNYIASPYAAYTSYPSYLI